MIIYLVVTPFNNNKFSTVEFLTEVLVLNGIMQKDLLDAYKTYRCNVG